MGRQTTRMRGNWGDSLTTATADTVPTSFNVLALSEGKIEFPIDLTMHLIHGEQVNPVSGYRSEVGRILNATNTVERMHIQ